MQLENQIKDILKGKPFSEKAKDDVLQMFLRIQDCYQSPDYITETKEQFMTSLLVVLKELKGCGLVELNALNGSNPIVEEFRTGIKKTNTRRGNLNYVDGRYVPSEAGAYYCSLLGFTWYEEKRIFVLDEGRSQERLTTLCHEMTHLEEGIYSFPLSRMMPFSFEISEMCREGRATTRESYLGFERNTAYEQRISDQSNSFVIKSDHSYPIYGKLYQTLQIIFGDSILEEMGKNNEETEDMYEILKQKYKELPIEHIFAHIIYILSCYNHVQPDDIIQAIKVYTQFRKEEIEWFQIDLIVKESEISKKQREMLNYKSQENELKQLLENPNKLNQNFLEEKEYDLYQTEAAYKKGTISEAIYKERVEMIQKTTLEEYRYMQEYALQIIQDSQSITQKELSRLHASLLRLKERIDMLKEDHLELILEEVCIRNPSLQGSFEYLEMVAFKKVDSLLEELPNEKDSEAQKRILWAQSKKIFELHQNCMLYDEPKKSAHIH